MLINQPLVRSAIENFKGTIPEVPPSEKRFSNSKEVGAMNHDEKILFALAYNVHIQINELADKIIGSKGGDSSLRNYIISQRLNKDPELNAKAENLAKEYDLYHEALGESVKNRISPGDKDVVVSFEPGYKIMAS